LDLACAEVEPQFFLSAVTVALNKLSVESSLEALEALLQENSFNPGRHLAIFLDLVLKSFSSIRKNLLARFCKSHIHHRLADIKKCASFFFI